MKHRHSLPSSSAPVLFAFFYLKTLDRYVKREKSYGLLADSDE